MPEATATFEVRRQGPAAIVDIRGDVTAGSEEVLMSAYEETGDATAIVLNFTDLSYMNSGGIGLLVTLLVRANRQSQQLLAFGLSDHYRADLRADPPRRGGRDPRHRVRRARRRGRRIGSAS